MTNSKIKASQVRAMLYKLRLTWGDKYHVFTDQKLYQLDSKIKTIDPAWPVSAPKERSNNQTPKILVNPAFVGKVRTNRSGRRSVISNYVYSGGDSRGRDGENASGVAAEGEGAAGSEEARD